MQHILVMEALDQSEHKNPINATDGEATQGYKEAETLLPNGSATNYWVT